MAVNENVYGRRENWTTPNSAQDWTETNTVLSNFLEAYYPKIRTGCPQGQTDGKLINLINAGTITRDTTIDSSPAWVYTYIDPQPIGYTWRPATEFTFSDFYYEGEWEGDAYHNDLTPIMFQVYRYTGNLTNSFLEGIDGWYAPVTKPNLVKSIKRNQATQRFSPGVHVSDEEIAEAIICADDTERFALTPSQVDPMYQEVYVQSTTNMYYVKDRDHLNSESGYQFMYSINDFKGANSSPIVSFCPKNFVLEINITYGTVVMDSGSSAQAQNRIITGPDGLFTSETIPLGDFTEELIQQRLNDIYTFVHVIYPEQHGGDDYPNNIYLTVFGMHCKVYNRSSGDTFTYTLSGDDVNIPIFNVLFNGGIRLEYMEEHEAPIVRYLYNQESSGRGAYSNLPLYGDIGGGKSREINVKPNYSEASNWENHMDFVWWSNNMSYIPVLLNINLYGSYYRRLGDGLFGYSYRIVPKVTQIDSVSDVDFIKDMAHETAAQYGLFFCDKYSDIATKDTPKMWVDPDMMCGTFEEQNGIRITRGYYTNGLDNLEQPQFFMTTSEGHTWNPDITWSTENDYPQIAGWDLLEFDTPPLPVNDIPTTVNDEYPMFPYWNITPIPVEPYPYPVFVTEQNYPDMPEWGVELLGAFAGVKELGYVDIPQSVLSIGYTAFAKTSITSVMISQNCEYYDESFPSDCEIKFYP